MMRVAMIADVHMSNALPHARPTSGHETDRLLDQGKIWDALIAVFRHVRSLASTGGAAERPFDALFVLGDLFDKRLVDAVTLDQTTRHLLAVAEHVQVFLIPGNHDAGSKAGGSFVTDYLRRVAGDKIRVFSEPSTVNVLEGRWAFRFLPWGLDNESELVALRAVDVGPNRRNVLLMHNAILNCKHLSWTCDSGMDPDATCEGFEAVFSGHFHTVQTFGKCGWYLGAPMQHTFGDEGEVRGWWDVDFGHDGEIEKRFVPLDLPSFTTVTGMEGVMQMMTSDNMKPGDYLRVVAECTHPDWLKQRDSYAAVVDELVAQGVRAHVEHRPIYHHAARVEVSAPGGAALAPEALVAKYLASPVAEVGSLDRERLTALAGHLLGEARKS